MGADRNVLDEESDITAQVVDSRRLEKGNKLLVIAFAAGPNVVADEQLDKVVLMMIKGLADQIGDSQSRFQILGADQVRDADFVLSGHVTGMATPAKWRRWALRPSVNKLSVEGRMTDAASGATIFVFTHSRQAPFRQKDHAQLGYEIGKDIGRFLAGAGGSSP